MNISGDDFIYRSQYIQKLYVFLLIFGIVTGTLLLNLMLIYRGYELIEEVRQYHLIMKNSFEMDIGVFIRIWIYRLGMAFFIYICMQVTGHCYIICPAIFLWGNSFGYTLSLLTFQYGWKGIVCMLVYLIPHYLIYLPLIIAVLREASSQMEKALKVNLMHGVVIMLLIFAGSGAESYINPFILKIFLKNFL